MSLENTSHAESFRLGALHIFSMYSVFLNDLRWKHNNSWHSYYFIRSTTIRTTTQKKDLFKMLWSLCQIRGTKTKPIACTDISIPTYRLKSQCFFFCGRSINIITILTEQTWASTFQSHDTKVANRAWCIKEFLMINKHRPRSVLRIFFTTSVEVSTKRRFRTAPGMERGRFLF